MSGGPYGPGGVLSDFGGGGEGGGGGSPRCILGETLYMLYELYKCYISLQTTD